MQTKYLLFVLIPLSFLVNSCSKDTPPPTKLLMQGNWELTEATDEQGKDILSKVAFPVTVIQLASDNGATGTQSPMFTYIVYGGSNWISVSSKIKQVFDYANYTFSNGDYYVGEGAVDRFTFEARLTATTAAGALGDILTLLNVQNAWIQQTIFHKFIDIKISFPQITNQQANVMIWEFDKQTQAVYSYRNQYGNTVAWLGWPNTGFTKGRFVFTKRIKGLKDLVIEHQ